MTSEESDVLVVGGGIVGLYAAYWLAQKGKSVTIVDQGDIPNQHAASGDHLRVFRLTYGKDAFYTEMAAKSMPHWLELNAQAGDTFLQQNGVLELATVTHGYEEQSHQVLKEMKLPCSRMEKDEIRRNYPMMNTRAIKWGLFHPGGGMLWAMKAATAVASLAQRKGVRTRPRVKIVSVQRDKSGIKSVKDAAGKAWRAGSYLFAAGAWTPGLLKGIPLKITRQPQLFLRPPANRGRYRPEHFPVFAALSQGFYGFPLHIHGFMKIADHRKGPPGKPGDAPEQAGPAFERRCRNFLGRFIPELASFTESEVSMCHYDNTPNSDFVIDRLPDAPNAYVACGFSGHGFKFAPIVGKTLAELISGARPELNLHRFRAGRFKRR